MPIFRYYNPYKRSNFYNYYRPPISCSYTPAFTKKQPEPISPPPKKEEIHSKINSTSISDNDIWLDIFGIKLYFDDILILSLLFFLYHEQIKDEGLFLSLILLLIS